MSADFPDREEGAEEPTPAKPMEDVGGRTFRMTIAYDGTAYAGWQRQPNGLAIQQLLEEALARIVGHETAVIGSGRTDAGVHARGQVCSFRARTALAPITLAKALQANVPHDIGVIDVRETLPDFHAQKSATGKRYRYCIDDGPSANPFLVRYAWRSYRRLNAERMQEAANRLVGTHDFKSFEAAGSARKSTVRTITHARVVREETGFGEALWFDVAANGFLYRMVRNLTGILFVVGRGSRDPEWIDKVLAAKTRTQKFPTAPPQGLFLWSVDYPPKYDGDAYQASGGRESPESVGRGQETSTERKSRAGQGRGAPSSVTFVGDDAIDDEEPA